MQYLLHPACCIRISSAQRATQLYIERATRSVQRAAHGSQSVRAPPCRHYAVDAPGRCLNNVPGTEFRVSPADMEAKLEARRR